MAFGDMPVMEMMNRGWLSCGFSEESGWPTVEQVRDALKHFFKDFDISDLSRARVCRIEPERIATEGA